MRKEGERAEEKRERMRQGELKRGSSSFQGSNLADLVGGLGWKGTLLLILVIIVGGIFLLLKFN